MKLRICVLIPGFSEGGAQKQCIFLLNELRKRPGITLTLIHFHKGVHDHLLDRQGFDVRQIDVSSNYDPRNVLKIRRVLKELAPDILMTWLHSCDVYGFFLKRTVPNMRWMMTERDSFYPIDPRYLLRRVLGRYADAIVANSQMGADYWQATKTRAKVSVIGNIVHHASADAILPTTRRIISIGRLEPQKNTRTVVEAFVLLAARHPDLTFAVIGNGSEKAELEAIAARSADADRIKFLGFREDIPLQIRDASLIVSSSHHEGLPNVMLESVAGRRLVVASDIPEHRELFGPDYPFYVTERNSPIALAEAVEMAIAAPLDISPLAYAQARLADMTATAVANKYLAIMRSSLEIER